MLVETRIPEFRRKRCPNSNLEGVRQDREQCANWAGNKGKGHPCIHFNLAFDLGEKSLFTKTVTLKGSFHMTIEINKGAHNYYWQFECQKFSPKAQNNGLLKLHWGKKKPTKLQTQKKKKLHWESGDSCPVDAYRKVRSSGRGPRGEGIMNASACPKFRRADPTKRCLGWRNERLYCLQHFSRLVLPRSPG